MAKCLNPKCKNRLTPYSPPTREVPLHLGKDPYCSRKCCEEHLGIQQRSGVLT